MRNRLAGLLFLIGTSGAAQEVVEHVETAHGRAGHACFVRAETDAGTGVTFQLSDYTSTWQLRVFVSNRAEYYRSFAAAGQIDRDRFRRAHDRYEIGAASIVVQDVFFPFTSLDEISDSSRAALEVSGFQNVAEVLMRMSGDRIVAPGLLDVTGLAPVFKAVRSCGVEAMGLKFGTRIAVRIRADYRMKFDALHTEVVEHLSTAENCGRRAPPWLTLAELEQRAAKAFFPGLLSFAKRASYARDLEYSRRLGTLRGVSGAIKGNCLVPGTLAHSRLETMQMMVRAAEELN